MGRMHRIKNQNRTADAVAHKAATRAGDRCTETGKSAQELDRDARHAGRTEGLDPNDHGRKSAEACAIKVKARKQKGGQKRATNARYKARAA